MFWKFVWRKVRIFCLIPNLSKDMSVSQEFNYKSVSANLQACFVLYCFHQNMLQANFCCVDAIFRWYFNASSGIKISSDFWRLCQMFDKFSIITLSEMKYLPDTMVHLQQVFHSVKCSSHHLFSFQSSFQYLAQLLLHCSWSYCHCPEAWLELSAIK